MSRHNGGKLADREQADLAALAELSERLSLVRADALHLLDLKPQRERLVADESRELVLQRLLGDVNAARCLSE